MVTPAPSNFVVYILLALVFTFLTYIYADHRQEKKYREHLREKYGEADNSKKEQPLDSEIEIKTCQICNAKNSSFYTYCWHCTNRITGGTTLAEDSNPDT